MSQDEGDPRVSSGARELATAAVLVVDRDEALHRGLVQLLAPHGLQVTSTADPDLALQLARERFFAAIVVDVDTPVPGAGAGTIHVLHELSPASSVIALSPRKSFDAAVSAYRAGAHDVIIKASDQVEVLRTRILAAAGSRQAGGRDAEVRELLEDFLKRLLEAERRTIELEEQLALKTGTGADPAEEVRVLVVDAGEGLFQALVGARVPGFQFALAHTGGEALDRVTSSAIHIALVAPVLPDLPGTMVVKALKAQAPELIVIAFVVGGRMEIVETTRTIPLLDRFQAPAQLIERLGELGAAHRARVRERRYLSAFRARHHELLRRLAALRKRL